MDWTTLLSATPSPYLPVADGRPQDLPLFVAIGESIESLTLTGADAVKFLQGQVTCDLNEIAAGGLRLGAHCNPKGRAQSTFLAYATPGNAEPPAITLLFPAGMAEPTQQQLKKFAVFSKVTLQQPTGTDTTMPLIVGGKDAQHWLASQGIATDTPLLQLAVTPTGAYVAALDDDRRLFVVLLPQSQLVNLFATLPTHTIFATQNGWWQCFTALGQAHVVSATQEEFIPQELNYDLNKGISFKKGCYKGQEIIARLHYKGTPKFRTSRFAWHSDAPPRAGTSLSNKGGQRIGQIVQVAQTGEHQYEVLLVAKTEALQLQEELLSDNGLAVRLTPLPIPYAIP